MWLQLAQLVVPGAIPLPQVVVLVVAAQASEEAVAVVAAAVSLPLVEQEAPAAVPEALSAKAAARRPAALHPVMVAPVQPEGQAALTVEAAGQMVTVLVPAMPAAIYRQLVYLETRL